jgi:hypothetical protein
VSKLCAYCGGSGMKEYASAAAHTVYEWRFCPCQVCRPADWQAWNAGQDSLELVIEKPAVEAERLKISREARREAFEEAAQIADADTLRLEYADWHLTEPTVSAAHACSLRIATAIRTRGESE